MSLRLRRVAAIRRALDLALYHGAYSPDRPTHVLRALDDAVTSLGLTTIPVTNLRELLYDLESRPPAPPVLLGRRQEYRPVISDHVAAAVRERITAAGEDDQDVGPVQILYAVADGLARAGLAVEAHYVTLAGDELAAGSDR